MMKRWILIALAVSAIAGTGCRKREAAQAAKAAQAAAAERERALVTKAGMELMSFRLGMTDAEMRRVIRSLPNFNADNFLPGSRMHIVACVTNLPSRPVQITAEFSGAGLTRVELSYREDSSKRRSQLFDALRAELVAGYPDIQESEELMRRLVLRTIFASGTGTVVRVQEKGKGDLVAKLYGPG